MKQDNNAFLMETNCLYFMANIHLLKYKEERH